MKTTTLFLNRNNLFIVFFNSREAIAAIIGGHRGFLQFKEFELYWGAVFLLRLFFLNNFIGVIFEAGNGTRAKIWSDFGAEQK